MGSRPYATSALEAAMHENFERANAVVSLTVAELQAGGEKAAAFTEQLATHAAKVAETYTASLKGLAETALSNLDYVKDTATRQFEDIAQRVDESRKHVVATMSSVN